MTSIFVILILIFISISLWQMIKIFDLSKAISGVKIDDSQIANDKDNSTQAKLMLAFLAFIYAITIFSIVKYGKFPLISNAASEHGDKIDTLMIWTLVLIFIVQIITQFLLYYFSFKYKGRKDSKALFYTDNHKLELMRLLYSLILILPVLSCESDDICAESINSTPRLIITFYDAENIETRKDVENLAIYAIKDGQLTLMNEINGITTDSINIPLRNDQSVSNFKFYKDFSLVENIADGIVDHLYVDYDIYQIFISKACGFINNYNLLNFLPYDPFENPPPPANWISGYVIENNLIENENQSHVKIFH